MIFVETVQAHLWRFWAIQTIRCRFFNVFLCLLTFDNLPLLSVTQDAHPSYRLALLILANLQGKAISAFSYKRLKIHKKLISELNNVSFLWVEGSVNVDNRQRTDLRVTLLVFPLTSPFPFWCANSKIWAREKLNRITLGAEHVKPSLSEDCLHAISTRADILLIFL